MSEDGRRFCENCGREVRETTNFCTNCGAAQRPDPEVPTGPPPPVPEPGRISTPDVPGIPPPPTPNQSGGGLWGSPRRSLITILVIVVIVIILGRGCGGGPDTSTSSSSGDKKEDAKTEAKKELDEKPKEKEDSNPNFSDGTHQVGTDIQPGTYRTREGSSGCYYARLSGFQGGLEEILSNENTEAPSIVTIEPTDAGFQSRRCGTWTQDLSPITSSTTSFEDGTYFVGSDIESGTYRSTGSSGCYYARLAGFGGGLET